MNVNTTLTTLSLWSFVSHDLLWNLMPTDSSINSSKSNKLPDLNLYLPKLAEAHQAALKINLGKGNKKNCWKIIYLLAIPARYSNDG